MGQLPSCYTTQLSSNAVAPGSRLRGGPTRWFLVPGSQMQAGCKLSGVLRPLCRALRPEGRWSPASVTPGPERLSEDGASGSRQQSCGRWAD